MQPIDIFDGHNDVLLRLSKSSSRAPALDFLNGEDSGHIDLVKARAGSLVGGMFALYSPSGENPLGFFSELKGGGDISIPMPPRLPIGEARNSIVHQLAILTKIERLSDGAVRICRTVAELKDTISQGGLAVLLHLEGADAIDEDLNFLEVLYASGLRSIGPVWSRDNIFGFGVPYRFPSSPDIGGGLTPLGEDLVRVCNDMRIVVDVSHTTEKGFWDIARVSKAPIVATHSNAHALCPAPRNLTDRQLDAIRDSGGMVGLNFATSFLRPDGAMRPDTELSLMVEQIDYLLNKVGENHVGLGSDFDGAVVPEDVGSAAKLPALIDALRDNGFTEDLLKKIGSKNWLSVLERTIG